MNKKSMSFSIAFLLMLFVESSYANDSIETLLIGKETCLQKDINSSQIICKIPADTVVSVKSVNDKWYNIAYNNNGENISGWVAIETNSSGTTGAGSITTDTGDATVTSLGTGLTTDQRNYLVNYTRVFITEGRQKNILLYYDEDATMLYNGYNMKLSSGTKKGGRFNNKLIYVCSTLTATLLHNALGVPLNGETSNGKTYTPTPIRGTGFCDPNADGKEIFFDVGNNYLEAGDVLAYGSFYTHVGLYLGYNEQTGYHEVAQTYNTSAKITNLSGTNKLGPKITKSQLYAATGKWAEAVRVKQEVLPRDWVRPSKINWPI